jgi:hypothetical protein
VAQLSSPDFLTLEAEKLPFKSTVLGWVNLLRSDESTGSFRDACLGSLETIFAAERILGIELLQLELALKMLSKEE